MSRQVDIIFLDKSVLETTFKDLGVAGLEEYTKRADKIFISPELGLELFPNDIVPESLQPLNQWLDSLDVSGRAAIVETEITAEDRARYNPSGKNDAIDGEKFDISVRKFMDNQPAGTSFEVVSNDVGLL